MPQSDRRRHRIFVTRRTEYHLRDDECVGVRDRSSGLWLVDHAALRLRALRVPPPGREVDWVGRRIQFWGSKTDVLTSPVQAHARPERHLLPAYVSHARSGTLGDATGSSRTITML
jgi:hypothetical protein